MKARQQSEVETEHSVLLPVFLHDEAMRKSAQFLMDQARFGQEVAGFVDASAVVRVPRLELVISETW